MREEVILFLLVRVVDGVINYLRTGRTDPEPLENLQGGLASVKDLLEQGRNPTPEEWEALDAEIKAEVRKLEEALSRLQSRRDRPA